MYVVIGKPSQSVMWENRRTPAAKGTMGWCEGRLVVRLGNAVHCHRGRLVGMRRCWSVDVEGERKLSVDW